MSGVTYVPPTEQRGVLPRQRAAYVGRVVRRFAGRLSLVFGILVVAGFAEGIGIASLLPLLSVLMDSAATEKSTLEVYTLQLLEFFGLEPEIGVLLTLTVVGIGIKAMLVLVSMSLVGIVMAQVATDLRLQFMRAIFSANWSYFTGTPIGNITNAMSRESDKAAALLSMLTRMVAASVHAFILLVLAALVSWQITVAAIGAGLFLVLLLNRIVGVARRAGRQEANAYVELSRRLSDAIQGIKALKAMAMERLVAPLLEREMGEINNALRRNAVAGEAMRTLQEPILVAIMAIGLYLLVTFGARSIEELIVMALLFYRTAGKFGEVQQFYQKVAVHEGFFTHMMERTRKAEMEQEKHRGSRVPTLDRGISLRNITFAYGEQMVLTDISFDVMANEITALVGPSGSGKTTLVDLVLGLHEATRSGIVIDDIPIEDVDITAWRQMIGYVPQELFLFHDTLRQNITLGAPDITDAQIERCVEAAGASEFVRSLPGGLDWVVGERGTKISGGQRQRIAIARALLRAPSLLILDEPTTALDPATEAALCATLEQLKTDVTILAISHQEAIAGIADVVCRLEGGTLKAVDRPAELIGTQTQTV